MKGFAEFLLKPEQSSVIYNAVFTLAMRDILELTPQGDCCHEYLLSMKITLATID